jgi:hypothetical protein
MGSRRRAGRWTDLPIGLRGTAGFSWPWRDNEDGIGPRPFVTAALVPGCARWALLGAFLP